MKLPLRTPLVLLCFTLFSFMGIQKASATHAMGADIAYVCIDSVNHVYVVTVNFYRDCSGIDAPSTISLLVEAASCGQRFTAVLDEQPAMGNPGGGTPYEVSPLCQSVLALSKCSNSNNPYPGVELHVYKATVTLPLACADWTFSISIGARNDAVTNLQNPGSENLYVEAKLNNLLAPANNSPAFTTLPVPYICINQPFFYNHGAVDQDGDSLYYSLVTPLGASAIPCDYVGTYSATSPMSTNGPFGFSNTNGQMSFTPSQIQSAVVTVLVQEFRNGVLIGSTMRDVQIVTLSLPGCGTPAPPFNGITESSVSGGFYIDRETVEVCPGNTISFSTRVFSLGNDSVFLESNVAQSIPGATFLVSRLAKDTVVGSFAWPTTITDTGQHAFVITIKDNHCPLASNQAYAITVKVLTGTTAGPDQFYCPSGGPIQLSASGGTQFTWSPATGLSNPNISNPTASPSQTTTYIVTSNLSSSCKNTDTVTVFRVADFAYTLSVIKDTICKNDITQLIVTADTAFGPYTYTWSPTAGLDSTTVPNPVAQPAQTTNYTVTIRSGKTGCSRNASRNIVVRGVGPRVRVVSDRSLVCVGDTVQLTSLVSTVNCGLNTRPCSGPGSVKQVGTGVIHASSTPTPYAGNFMASRMQLLFKASELIAQGMKPGTISSVAFDIYRRNNSGTYRNFTIRMGCTEKNVVTTMTPGLQDVFFTSNFIPTGTGWNTHTFNTPYDWDGISNLLVEVCFTNVDFDRADIINATASGFNSVVYAQADNQIGCNLDGSITTVISSATRPNVRFDFCEALPVNTTHLWTPEAGLITKDSLNPKAVIDGNTTYYLTVDDSSCVGTAGVTINIDDSYTIDLGPDISACNGVPVQLKPNYIGEVPRRNLTCGVNGTTCNSTTPEVKTINLSGAAITGRTMFLGDNQGSYEDSRSQILYLASYLNNAGIKKGTITQLGFNILQKNSTVPYQDLTIKMGCTAKQQLDDFSWEPTAQVYTSTTYAMQAGWNDFVLQNTFDWDGVSNIVVEVCWNNPNGVPQTGADLVGMQTTTYVGFHTIARSDAVGCNLSTPTQRYYTEIPPMRINICPPPILPTTYSWTPTNSGLSPNDTTEAPFATPSQPTLYRVVARFDGTCSKADEILVSPVDFGATLTPDRDICLGDSVQLLATNGNKYEWSGDGLSCYDCPNPTLRPTQGGVYSVVITDTTTGCTQQLTVTIGVVEPVDLTPPFIYDTINGADNDSVMLVFNINGGNGIYTYTWNPGDYLDRTDTLVAISRPTEDVQYTLIAVSGPCMDSSIIKIEVLNLDSIVVPTAFVPGRDNLNGTFYPIFMNQGGVSTVKAFRVYNRYGQLVHDAAAPWDGRFKGADQPVGTYIYYLSVSTPDNGEKRYQGSVTLLR